VPHVIRFANSSAVRNARNGNKGKVRSHHVGAHKKIFAEWESKSSQRRRKRSRIRKGALSATYEGIPSLQERIYKNRSIQGHKKWRTSIPVHHIPSKSSIYTPSHHLFSSQPASHAPRPPRDVSTKTPSHPPSSNMPQASSSTPPFQLRQEHR
jgi:hypothetical protein